MLCESWDGSKEKTCYRAPFRGESAERLPEFAAELVRLKVDVTVGIGTLAPLADKRATTTIPIVMTATDSNCSESFSPGLRAWLCFGMRPIRMPRSSSKRRKPQAGR
jgi:hypothetical protein